MVQKDYLMNLYYDQKLSLSEIEVRSKKSVATIVYWMEKYKLRRRTKSEALRIDKPPIPKKEELAHLYLEKNKNQREIAKSLNEMRSTNYFTQQIISYWMKKFHIKIRTHSELSLGTKNGFYGKKHSERTRCLMSKNHRDVVGGKNPFFGREHSVESLRKNSLDHKLLWRNPEWRNHQIEVRKGKVGVWHGKKRPEISGSNHWFYGKERLDMQGDKNPSWRGGHHKYYGPNWDFQRRKALERDHYACKKCGKTRKEDIIQVHHIMPFGEYGLENYREANKLINLISLCNGCHSIVEWNETVPPSHQRLAQKGIKVVYTDEEVKATQPLPTSPEHIT